MVDIKKLLEGVDFAELGRKMAEMKEIQCRQVKEFWNGELCQKMIQDVLTANTGFDSEGFAYFPEKIRATFGWADVSTEEIELFINTMAHQFIGLPPGYVYVSPDESSEEDGEDEDYDVSSYSHVKGGVLVSVLHGQGCIVILQPEKLK